MAKIVALYRYFSDKRYSTIAGTLVYFLLMSVTPFLLWLTIIVGGDGMNVIISNEVFAAVTPVVRYLKTSAESAAGSAGIILLVTSLYSSTNFFYHLRRSGEIIYNCKKGKGGVRLRLYALIAVFCTILAFSVVTALLYFVLNYRNNILSSTMSDIISFIIAVFAAFCAAYLLNLFACPYRTKADRMLPGSFLTTALWLIFAFAFTIYLQFANPTMLYGKLAAFIIFLLWCYLMTNSLVVGIIYNGMFMTDVQWKKLF